MNRRNFSLQPFAATGSARPVVIDGIISRRSHTLILEYFVTGRPAAVAIPARAPTPLRLDGLWQDTCFECFLAVKCSPQYWEFNISPAGHWNVYRFTEYRRGMTEETAFQFLPCTCSADDNLLALALQIDLAKIVADDQQLEIAVSAVIRYRNMERDYWAVTHADSAPDFHRRECFTIQL